MTVDEAIDAALAENPDMAAQAARLRKIRGELMDKVMKADRRLSPAVVAERLLTKLMA